MARTSIRARRSTGHALHYSGKPKNRSKKTKQHVKQQIKTRKWRSRLVSQSDDDNDAQGSTSVGTVAAESAIVIDFSMDVADSGDKANRRDTLLHGSGTTVALLKEVVELFQNIPYVKVAAGVALQILNIVDEVQTNKERSLELAEKVMSYSRVVFEAVLQFKGGDHEGIQQLKDDLFSVGSVLTSILQILQSFTITRVLSRLARVVNREGVLAKIEQLDRKLDTAITSFLLKSAIVLRTVQPKVQPNAGHPLLVPRKKFRFDGLPPKPQLLLGREQDIDTLVSITPPFRIVLLGPGGIGKTSLALCTLHHEKVVSTYQDRRIFISCEAAASIELIVFELARSLHIDLDTITESSFANILQRLRQHPHLIVLDNFETPWDNVNCRPDAERLLVELAAVETVSLILTLRGSQHPPGVNWTQLLPPLQPIDRHSALLTFQAISRKSDVYTEKLVDAVDRLPLAVTLLGHLAAVDGETTEALWRRWETEYTSMIENGDDRLSNLEHSIRLSLASPRVTRNPEALTFLSLLASLPSGFSQASLARFESATPGVCNIRGAISTLKQNSLVFDGPGGFLRILNPIRQYLLQKLPPSNEAKSFLMDSFLDLADQASLPHTSDIQKRLKEECQNIEEMLVQALHSPFSLERAIHSTLSFCNFLYATSAGSCTTIALATEKLCSLPHGSRPIGGRSSPSTIQRVGWFTPNFTSPRKMVDNIGGNPNQDPTLKLQGDCYGCWAQLLSRHHHFTQAEEKITLAIEFHKKADDTSGHAYDLHNLGNILVRNPERLPQAEALFKEAARLHGSADDMVGKAYDFIALGSIQLQSSQLRDAVASFTLALDLFTSEGDDPGCSVAHNYLGDSSLALARYGDAETHFNQALELNTKTGGELSQAESLCGLASCSLLQSRFAEARARVEKAMELRAPACDPDHLHILSRICIAKSNHEQAVVLLEQAVALHTENGDLLGQAEDAHYLAIALAHYRPVEEVSRQFEKADELYARVHSPLGRVDHLAAKGSYHLHLSQLESAEQALTEALVRHTELGCLQGRAFDLHALGCLRGRRSNFKEAIPFLEQALTLHQEVGNVQAQADDRNKLADALLGDQLIDKALVEVSVALALHISIGDVSGQGDDLYVQGCIFMEQCRHEDAARSLEAALELHSCWPGRSYAKGRYLSMLGTVLWGWSLQSPNEKLRIRAVEAMEEAMSTFRFLGLKSNLARSRAQRVLMY